jgi:hypothetical protein
VWAFDCIARSVRHLEVLDEFNHLNIEFVSFSENLDTDGALGRSIGVIVVRAGMRRAQLEGQQIGRKRLDPIGAVALTVGQGLCVVR